MTPKEVERYRSLTHEIKRLEAGLEEAIKSKQALAKTLYERHGKGVSYLVDGEYMIVAPTKKEGTYYFAPRVRWSKEAAAAKAERKRLDRLARMQRPLLANLAPRRVEIMANLSPNTRIEPPQGGSGVALSQDPPPEEVAAHPTPAFPADSIDEYQSKRHLPLVGQVDQPVRIEPRLLQIQEPRDDLDQGLPLDHD